MKIELVADKSIIAVGGRLEHKLNQGNRDGDDRSPGSIDLELVSSSIGQFSLGIEDR